MKKFCSVSSYSAIAALVLALSAGTSPVSAGEVPALVELQAAPTALKSPIVIAEIKKVTKSQLVRVPSASERAAAKEAAAALKALEEAIKSGDQQKITNARAKLTKAERKVQLAEVKAQLSLVQQQLEEAKQNNLPAEAIEALEQQLAAVESDLDELNPTPEERVISSNDISRVVDPEVEDPNASPSR